jgi:hypothetical protein
MSEKLSVLYIRAADEFFQLSRSQKLIDLCLEEDGSSKEAYDRVELLLEAYQCKASNHFDELQVTLKLIGQLIAII